MSAHACRFRQLAKRLAERRHACYRCCSLKNTMPLPASIASGHLLVTVVVVVVVDEVSAGGVKQTEAFSSFYFLIRAPEHYHLLQFYFAVQRRWLTAKELLKPPYPISAPTNPTASKPRGSLWTTKARPSPPSTVQVVYKREPRLGSECSVHMVVWSVICGGVSGVLCLLMALSEGHVSSQRDLINV